jgi:predicted N-acetyltransferase YhbS
MSTRWETNQFELADVEAVVALWQRVFPDYYLSVATLRKFTFDHPNFDPNGAWVARDDGQIVGFGLATDMEITEGPLSQMPGTIPMIFVDPAHRMQGIGRDLLKKAESYLRDRGKDEIHIGYPTYVQGTILSFPGVCADWMDAHWFFQHFGYGVRGTMDSARCPLDSFTIPPKVQLQIENAAAEGMVAGPGRAEDEPDLMAFLKEWFKGVWYEHLVRRAERGVLVHENVTVFRQAECVLGFVGPVDYSPSGEAHMGVGIGIAGNLQGKGLGNVILYTFLQMLKDRGARECMIYGVGPRRYYAHAGFRMSELWLMMDKPLR